MPAEADPDEDFLREILGQRSIPCHPQTQTVHAPTVVAIKSLEGPDVTLAG